MTIQQDIATVLGEIVKLGDFEQLPAEQLQERTGLTPEELNTAVQILEDSGYARVVRYMGTAPFAFGTVQPTAQGRLEYERATSEVRNTAGDAPAFVRPTQVPVGSPFGFTDLDWEYVFAAQHSRELIVVFGRQFESHYYDSNLLAESLRSQFQAALDATEYRDQLTLKFQPLRGVYGEHLFNAIAREIIGADIAVFETSDLNANVMIEMGVALTQGTRVYPIREMSASGLPSDISGLMWARYRDNGNWWEAPNHFEALVAAVDFAARKKLSRPPFVQ